MLKFVSGSALIVAATAILNAALAVAADAPNAVALIFDRQHLSNTKKGDEITYVFNRTVSDEKLTGAAFKDEIKLKIEDIDKDGKKNIALKVYTGERAREEQKVTEITINPMFVVAMQQAVSSYKLVAGGDFSYLKHTFSMALKDTAKIDPVKIDYNGKTVDGFKIGIVPFVKDPNVAKMKGYETSAFTFVVSDNVPGEIVEFLTEIKNSAKEAPTFEERTTLAGVAGVK